MYSDILATVALVVSLLTAGWTAYRALRWSRPVVTVTGSQWIGGASGFADRHAGFSIDVANTGDHATHVVSAYWEQDCGDGTDRRVTSGEWADMTLGAGRSVTIGLKPEKLPPPMPFVLERYDTREWDILIPLTTFEKYASSIRRERPVVEYMTRKRRTKAYGSWQPSQIRLDADRRAASNATEQA